MGVTPAGLAVIAILQFMTSGQATSGNAGFVVAAPHGGYDQDSEDIARRVANRLGWGWVRAIAYRSYPFHQWYDVNRPTERPWRFGRFTDNRETTKGRRVYTEYQRKLKSAARRSGPLTLLVEIHGHSRTERVSGRTIRIEVIELATAGFTRAELRRLKASYERLQRSLPSSQRVKLAIDRLDSRYDYRGYSVPFYYTANSAKRTGSLRSSQTRRALHFELPPRVRGTASTRRAYERLLAQLLDGL
jgi:hypothetical protein